MARHQIGIEARVHGADLFVSPEDLLNLTVGDFVSEDQAEDPDFVSSPPSGDANDLNSEGAAAASAEAAGATDVVSIDAPELDFGAVDTY